MTSYNMGYLSTVSGGASTDLDPVKDRLLINLGDNSYGPNLTGTSSLEKAANEATNLIDIFLKPYLTDITVSSPHPYLTIPTDVMIQMICADFTAGIFKRRQYPTEQQTMRSIQPDMINDVEGSGWFAVGFKRLQDYIKVQYSLGVPILQSSEVITNPDRFGELFSKGYITLMELRTLLSNPNAVIQENVNRKEMNNVLNVKSDTELKTLRKYITSKQKSFVFISGGRYGNQTNKYYIDGEVY